MKRYVHQLLTDIQIATTNVQRPFTDSDENLINWLSDEEEERTAPRIPLEDWTGIRKAQLPPQEYLDDERQRSARSGHLCGARLGHS